MRLSSLQSDLGDSDMLAFNFNYSMKLIHMRFNRFHVLIITGNGNISTLMKNLKNVVFNKT